MFLELNGYVLTIPDGVFVAELILGVIEGRGTEQEFAELLRDWIVPTPGADAR
jgi:prophage maintenance system killer protein